MKRRAFIKTLVFGLPALLVLPRLQPETDVSVDDWLREDENLFVEVDGEHSKMVYRMKASELNRIIADHCKKALAGVI